MLELRDIRDLHAGPWLVAGDFNLIVNSEDKKNGRLHRGMMGRFRRLLADLELKELYLAGRRFTWSNERGDPTLEKIDRVFSTADWEVLLPNAYLSALSTATSDHSPLLLDLAADLRVGRRFHFESFWPKVPGFSQVVDEAWNGVGCDLVNPFQRVAFRLRHVARRLRSWSDKFIGNVKLQLLIVTEVILRLDVAMERRLLSIRNVDFVRSLSKNYWDSLLWRVRLRDSALGFCGLRMATPTRVFFT